MILAIYERNGDWTGGLWDSWDSYFKETFSPECETMFCWDFTTKGKTYAARKNYLRDFAVDWSNTYYLADWSYYDLAVVQSGFERLGRRYGLLREFRENCIC